MRPLAAVLLLLLFTVSLLPAAAAAEKAETKTIRILATSDTHGKFMPWDYALNEESLSGSLAQVSSAVRQYRTDATLLVDAGDTIQDNAADIFVRTGKIHPMIQAMNAMKYDVWVTGNHEYNYGMGVVRQAVADSRAKVLAGNVYFSDGTRVGDRYAIFDVDGVRVAVIGMVTPNIVHWDAENLAGCVVTDPYAETREVIDSIRGQYDVLVGVFHMGLQSEYGMKYSGVEDILNDCPEFDVMVSAHEHALVPSMDINGVLVVQNKNQGQTMSVIDVTLEKDSEGWKVIGKTAGSVDISGFVADPELVRALTPAHEYALADAWQPIGRLEGGPLAPENEIEGIPEARIRDTALIDLINSAQLYYSGAQVSATALFTGSANMRPGVIRKSDMALIYKHSNTLCTLRVTGAQLRKYMEWSASYYSTWRSGDLTISFNPEFRDYWYDMFAGVNYEIDISAEPGNRIRNLSWPDGTPVADNEEFVLAVNNYRARSFLLVPGFIFEEGGLPVLLETDIHGELGGVREMIRSYIVDVKDAKLTPECDHNWRLIGADWDPEKHAEAAALLKEGKLPLPAPQEEWIPYHAVTVEDLERAREDN